MTNDGLITIATGSSRYCKAWKNEQLLFSAFCDRLRETTRTQETVEEFRGLPKDRQDSIKDVGGFVGGQLLGGRRRLENAGDRQLLTLDADSAEPDLLEDLEMLLGCAYAAYSTHKHTPEAPRLRICIPLSRPVGPDAFEAISRWVCSELGIRQFDPSTHEVTRLMYWPTTPADGEYVFQAADAPWLDVDRVLSAYPGGDWRDVANWPTAPEEDGDRKRRTTNAGDPREKPDMIGPFCRTYDIHDAIAKFLPEVYEQIGTDECRYTYTGGSSSGGMVVYNDGLFAYSNHATDPAARQCCNAFDLVRIHRFGELDDGQSDDTRISRLPSYKAMSSFAAADDGVKATILAERQAMAANSGLFEADGDDAPDVVASDAWKMDLTMDKRGAVQPTAGNLLLILSRDAGLAGALALNEFCGLRKEVRGPLPWRQAGDLSRWTDSDESQLRLYLEMQYGIESRQKVQDAVDATFSSHRYHPVRDYLCGLPAWDGVQRLDTLLIDYLGADDTPYVRACTRKAFTAAVARVFEPGRKFDYVLTLVGAEGLGKSTLIRKMAVSWFTDSLIEIGKKESFEALQGYWLVELGELAALRRQEVETVKSFISKTSDAFRGAYKRNADEFPRQCVFFGTTNNVDFLRGDTGNRRFWPVMIGVQTAVLDVFGDLTPDEIGRIWAEAVHRYRSHEPLILSAELEKVAREEQLEFSSEDPHAGEILQWLDQPVPVDWRSMSKVERLGWLENPQAVEVGDEAPELRQRSRVCAAEILTECLKMKNYKHYDASDVRAILRKSQVWRETRGKQRCGPYGVQRVFERVE